MFDFDKIIVLLSVPERPQNITIWENYPALYIGYGILESIKLENNLKNRTDFTNLEKLNDLKN